VSRLNLNVVIWVLIAVLGVALIASFFVDLGPFLYALPAGMVVLFALDWWSRQRRPR
jgi:hypothetical protein